VVAEAAAAVVAEAGGRHENIPVIITRIFKGEDNDDYRNEE